MKGTRIWFASLGAEDVCTLAIWPHGSDAHVMWVATLPEARNRGIAGRLLAHALAAARDEDAMATSTLEASKLGQAVYTRIGFRQCGVMQMWEKRRAD
jgi:GNAT superfamily N-acetyltransferase